MNNQLNKTLLCKIGENVPKEKSLVRFLSETLNLSNMSAYRRLNGDTDFTFQDVYKIALALDLSIDEIFGLAREGHGIFQLERRPDSTPEEVFTKLLEGYYTLSVKQHNSANTGSIIAMNRLLSVFTIQFEHLFKFFYYKWIHQMYYTPPNFCFAQVTIPENIKELINNITKNLSTSGSVTIIFDPNVYTDIISEIMYYKNRKLISDEDLALIKNDLSSFIDSSERCAIRGVNDYGSPSNYYLSTLNIESSSTYTWYEDKTESYFYWSSVNPIGIQEKDVCAVHKKWLESLKKYSILITGSNEVMQSNFFDKQRKNLDAMI